MCDCAQNVYSKNVLEYTFSKKNSIRNLYNAYGKCAKAQPVVKIQDLYALDDKKKKESLVYTVYGIYLVLVHEKFSA